MNVLKAIGKILMWLLSLLLFLCAIVYAPSVASVLFLLGGLLSLPVRPLQNFLSGKGLKSGVSTVLACALFFGGAMLTPPRETSRNDHASTLEETEDAAKQLSSPDKNTEDPAVSVDDCIKLMEDVGNQRFGDDFEIARDGNTVEFIAWNDDILEELPLALAGRKVYTEAWSDMGASFANLSSSIQNFFDNAGHNEIIARVTVIDSPETKNTIFSAQNGKTVYDIVNHVDTLGVNKARAEAVAANFDGLIDGVAVSANGTYNKIEVHIPTDFSAETKPENWEDLQQTVLDRMSGVALLDGTTLYVMLETSGGDILATAANGKVSYDCYQKAENTAHSATQKAESDENDILVYVSNSTHTIHSISDCSGMKHYTGMKLSKALANRYDFCPHCW